MAWYNNNWQYRQKITIAASEVSSDLTNFPYPVDLAQTQAGFFTNVKSDGSDIVFTASNGTTKLDRELVFIVTGSSIGEAFVRIPTISSSTDTEIYMYYGYSGASETNDTGTWRTEYKLVSHYETNANNSTAFGTNGTVTGASLTTGGGGAFYSGECYDYTRSSSEYINYADSADWDITGELTVQCWHNATSFNFSGLVVRMTTNPDRVWATINNSTTNMRFRVTSSGTNYDFTVSTMSTGTWYSSTFTYSDSGNEVEYFQNGSEIGTGVSCTETLAAGAEPIRIAEEGGSDYYDGKIDEVRVYAGIPSDAWISFEYGALNDWTTAGTFAAEEENAPTPSVSDSITVAEDVTVELAVTSYDQYVYRFRNDDGSETTATWKAAEDTNITVPKETNFRLRFGIDTSDRLSNEQYAIQSKVKTDAASEWADIPLS